MYTLILGDETREFETRKKAVEAAKDISDGSYGRVDVQDQKSKELMRFRNGDLELYVFETRPGRTVKQ